MANLASPAVAHPTTTATDRPHTSSVTMAAVMVIAPLLLVTGRGLMLVPSARGFTTWWTVTHVMFLAGTVLMIPAALALSRLARGHAGPVLRDLGVAVVFVGALALAAQFVVDLTVSVLADGDPQAGGALFDQLQAVALIDLTLYVVGPALLFVGLIVQAVALARVRAVPRWAVIALVAGPSLDGIGRATGQAVVEVAGLALIAIAMAASAMWGAD